MKNGIKILWKVHISLYFVNEKCLTDHDYNYTQQKTKKYPLLAL